MTPVFGMLALAIMIAAVSFRASAGLRVRRRTRWELERAEWRVWIARP